MIITRLTGGLGNQFFQYAAGRRLAHKHRTDLGLETSRYSLPTAARRYELDAFAIKARIVSLAEFNERVADCARRQAPMAYVKEPHFHFFPPVLEAPNESYFEGYWQSERYFAEIGPLLRQELTLTAPLDDANQRLLADIQSPAGPAVSLHVRRTDYITDPRSRVMYVNCGVDYYERGISHLLARLTGARFFVFSDDQAWAAAHILPLIPAPRRLVTGNDRRGPTDVTLMRHCRHHLIANSSFSWWGAWLSDAPDKQVVAPADWFIPTDMDTRDLIPAEWTRLPVGSAKK